MHCVLILGKCLIGMKMEIVELKLILSSSASEFTQNYFRKLATNWIENT